MAVALALAERTRGRTAPNPNVGCVIVRDGRVVGRGWTQPGGRPHAEAMAIAQAGDAARGATAYVTLEPCAHESPRGPACSAALVAAGVAQVMAGIEDPDPRTAGRGFAALRDAGRAVESGILAVEARRSMAGFLTRRAQGRPFVTLKLATSLDGCIALADGSSRWITGPEARAHAHLERSRHEAILVGRGTLEADSPRLDVRSPGLEERSPSRVVLSTANRHPSASINSTDPRHPSEGWGIPVRLHPARQQGYPSLRWGDEIEGGDGLGEGDGRGEGDDMSDWTVVASPEAIATLPGDHLLVEGGAVTASAFLAADLVDRLLLYRAPVLVGGGKPAIGDIGLGALSAAHGRWQLHDARMLGSDRLEVYERARKEG